MRKPTTSAVLWLLRFVVLVSATMLCLCLSVHAQRITRIAPGTSIQAAIDAAVDGDTLVVAPGIYFENLNLRGKAVTLVSAEGPSVTILEGRGLAPVVTFATHETRATTLSGFTIRHGAGAVFLVDSAPTITGNVLTENLCSGIDARGSAPLLMHNTITHTQPGPHCIAPIVLGESAGAILRGNLIEHNDLTGLSGGVALLGGHATLEGNVIRSNSTSNHAPSALALEGDALVIQNLIYANTTQCGPSVSVAQGTLRNNTIADNLSAQDCPAAELRVTPQVLLTNNIVASATHAALASTAAQPYNLLDGTDPLFVDRAHADYHLSANSPALDAGTSAIALPERDLDDAPRTHGGRIDLGAYEHAVPHAFAASTTFLFATPNPAEAFQAIALNVLVTAANTTPTGSVTFAANGQTLATIALDSAGRAAFTTTTLPAGTTLLTATYAGSEAASTSTQSLRITPATTLLSFALTPSSADETQAVTLSASVAAPLSTQVPSGQIQFVQMNPSKVLATVPLDTTGHATVTLPAMAAGTWMIDAAYLATPNFASVALPASDALPLLIAARGYSLTSAAPTVAVQSGHHTTVALTLRSLGTFAAGLTLACADLPANASCVFSPASPTLTAGSTLSINLTVDTNAVPGFLSRIGSPAAPLLACVFLCFVRLRRRGVGLLAGIGLMVSLTGCTSKYPDQVPSGTYSIQIVSQASGSSSSQTLPITLLVTN